MKVNNFMGAKSLNDGTLLLDFFRELHVSANLWSQFQGVPSRQGKVLDLDQQDTRKLHSLEMVDTKDWSSLCTASGWTVYGAVATSWCKDAELSQVWEGWEASGFPLKPLPEFERPARFLNPALMPQTRSLKGIVEAVGNSSLAICAAIASRPEPLEFDLPIAQMQAANPQPAAFLKSRMLEKPDRTAEENALLKAWSETVKDTEYDIWEGS